MCGVVCWRESSCRIHSDSDRVGPSPSSKRGAGSQEVTGSGEQTRGLGGVHRGSLMSTQSIEIFCRWQGRALLQVQPIGGLDGHSTSLFPSHSLAHCACRATRRPSFLGRYFGPPRRPSCTKAVPVGSPALTCVSTAAIYPVAPVVLPPHLPCPSVSALNCTLAAHTAIIPPNISITNCFGTADTVTMRSHP